MSSDLRLSADTLALVVVDVQERLAAAMPEADATRCVRKIDLLLEAARLMDIPVLVSEQYPKGLGPTVEPLRARLDTFDPRPPVVQKLDFDATSSAEFTEQLDHLVTHRGEGSIRTVVAVGMEAHVCVYQTVRGLLGGGFGVHVPWDATCSRALGDAQVARELWARAGAVVTSAETVVFDLMGSARHESFKALSKLISGR